MLVCQLYGINKNLEYFVTYNDSAFPSMRSYSGDTFEFHPRLGGRSQAEGRDQQSLRRRLRPERDQP